MSQASTQASADQCRSSEHRHSSPAAQPSPAAAVLPPETAAISGAAETLEAVAAPDQQTQQLQQQPEAPAAQQNAPAADQPQAATKVTDCLKLACLCHSKPLQASNSMHDEDFCSRTSSVLCNWALQLDTVAVQAARRQRQAKKARQKRKPAKGKAVGRPAARQVASASPHPAAGEQPAGPAPQQQQEQQQQQQHQQAPAAVSAPNLLNLQAPPAQRPTGDAEQQQEAQDLRTIPAAAHHRRRRLTRAAVRADEPPQAPAAAPHLAAVPEEVPVPPAQQSPAQVEQQPAAAAASPGMAAANAHAHAEPQPQPADMCAQQAAQAPDESHNRSPSDERAGAVVLEAAAPVAPEPAARQQVVVAPERGVNEQENQPPHRAASPPANAPARHEPAAFICFAGPTTSSYVLVPHACAILGSRPYRWEQQSFTMTAGGESASFCRRRRHCWDGWQSWIAAAAPRRVQTQLKRQPRARPAAAHWRSFVAAMAHGRSGSGAERNSLGTDRSVQAQVWAVWIVKAKGCDVLGVDASQTINSTNGIISTVLPYCTSSSAD